MVSFASGGDKTSIQCGSAVKSFIIEETHSLCDSPFTCARAASRICQRSVIHFGRNILSVLSVDCCLFRWECFVISVRDLSFVSVGGFCRICRWGAIRFGRNILSGVDGVLCRIEEK